MECLIGTFRHITACQGGLVHKFHLFLKDQRAGAFSFFFYSVLPVVLPRFCDFLVQTKHHGTPACKSSHCWPGSPECLDTVFVPSPLLAPDLTHHLTVEPAYSSLKELTCNCAF